VKAWESAAWGLAGGGAAGLLSLMATVISNGYAWWSKDERGPRLFVFGCALVLGAGVAAAASGEMSGPWPAFVIGIGAPATIKGLLSGVEVVPASQPALNGSPKTPTVKSTPDTRKEAADESLR
jgi:hypothetical protein